MKFNSKSFKYRKFAYKIIYDCVSLGSFGRPPEGFYHLIFLDIGTGETLFYRVKHDRIETTDGFNDDILDCIYSIKYQTTVKDGLFEDTERKVLYNTWRHFELTS